MTNYSNFRTLQGHSVHSFHVLEISYLKSTQDSIFLSPLPLLRIDVDYGWSHRESISFPSFPSLLELQSINHPDSNLWCIFTSLEIHGGRMSRGMKLFLANLPLCRCRRRRQGDIHADVGKSFSRHTQGTTHTNAWWCIKLAQRVILGFSMGSLARLCALVAAAAT